MISGNKPGSQEVPESEAQQEINEVPEQATDALAEQVLDQAPEATDAISQEELESPEEATNVIVEGTGVEKSETETVSTKATGTDTDEILKSECSTSSEDGSQPKTAVLTTIQNISLMNEVSSEKSSEVAAMSNVKSETKAVHADETLKEVAKPLASDQEIFSKPLELSNKPVEATTQTSDVTNSQQGTEASRIKISEASSTVSAEPSEVLMKTSDVIPQKDSSQSPLVSADATAAALSDAMSKLLVASPDTSSESVSDDSLKSPVGQSRLPVDTSKTPFNSLSQSPDAVPLGTTEITNGQNKPVEKSADVATSTTA